jgi:hypothetical protein
MSDEWMSDESLEAEADIESALPLVVGGGFDNLAPEDVDALFANASSQLTSAEAESLGDALRAVGRWANDRQLGQLAGTVLPTAGAAIGTVYGGPIGMAIGRTVGERAGQAVAGNRPATPATAPAAAPTAPRQAGTAPAPRAAEPTPTIAQPASGTPTPEVGGSPAAAKLLYLVQNPAFLSSLIALALGPQGQQTVPLGADGKPVRVGAFVNAANSLASQAAQDADALVLDGDTESEADTYLKDESGAFLCDPAVPEQRANALLKLLQQDDKSFSARTGDGETDDETAWDSWAGEW